MAENLKEKVFKIVKQRNLCSYMNNTKWKELINSMLNDMPFPPPYDIKYVDLPAEDYNINKDIYYHGDWYEPFQFTEEYVAIEWIKIKPAILKHRGFLISPEVIDETQELINILEKYNIPYEEKDGIYTIYGYR